MGTKMTDQEIEEYIEEVYPKVKDLVGLASMTKDQWIVQAIRRAPKLFMRCENCRVWPCESTESLKGEWDMFLKVWYEHGCNCHLFDPKEGAK